MQISADGRHDFRHLEALLEEASKEAERTVKHLKHSRTATDFRLHLSVAAAWAFAALGWSLFMASHFGYLTKGILPFTLVEDKAVDDNPLWPDVGDEALSRSVARTLASSSSSNGQSSGTGSHESHDADALLFLFIAIIISVVILYATTFKMFSKLQHTVTLFIVGVIYSLILEIDSTYTKLGVFGRSHQMWMSIDPHLLLFTMLPALLTADAMTINTSIAFRVAKQCIYLAGPGVLFNATMTALFLWVYLPYDWSFMLCLTTGSILCATDPVAVVALLKELGASPTLTVQIQGESLLNDGTAIVLYMISYNILKGEKYDFTDVIVFMVKTAMCAWVLGMFVGFFFLEWIRYANRKLEHNSSLIQCTLTLCCAYWSFILAEGVFSISGVLSCVAAAIVLAHKMWPAIVDKEFLHHIWHMFEYLGNTVIFFLAGALTGRTMVHIPGADYLHLFVIYIVLVVVRGFLFFASRPILRILGPDREPVSIADCLVMTWGGLRGAVGLSLAIQVNTDRAEGEISEKDGQRVLFYVSGVAALTLLINATTCPLLVQHLGITQLPGAKKLMLRLLVQRLRHLSNERPHCALVTKTIAGMLDDVDHHMQEHGRHSDITSDEEEHGRHSGLQNEENFFSVNPQRDNNEVSPYGESEAESDPYTSRQGSKPNTTPPRNTGLAPSISVSYPSEVLEHPLMGKAASERPSPKAGDRSKAFMKELNLDTSGDGKLLKPTSLFSLDSDVGCKSENLRMEGFRVTRKKLVKGMEKKLKVKRRELKDGVVLATSYKNAKAGVTAIKFLKIADNNFTEITRDLPKISFTLREQEEDILHICKYIKPDKDMQRVFVEVFLKLVCADYWKQIGSGAVPNQRDGEILLLTITLALSKAEAELHDFLFLRDWIQSGSLVPKSFQKTSSDQVSHHAPASIQSFYRSYVFNIFIIINIVISAAAVWVEEAFLNNGDDFYHHKTFWTVLEIWFLVIFILEFIFKFWDLHCKYFADILNNFDFTLIWVGFVGLIVTQFLSSGGGEQAQDVSQQGRLVRGARLFRALRLMRILRIFRLLEFVKVKMKVSQEGLSKDVSCHMQKVMMLRAFVGAHIHAQEAFIHTFCKDEQVETAEIARVLIDSMTSVNLAIAEAVQVEQSVDKRLLTQVRLVRECTDIAEHLEKFVFNAHTGGVITSKEAESIMHPLHAHLERFYTQLRRTQRGVTQKLDEPKRRRSMFKKMGSMLGVGEREDSFGEKSSENVAGLMPMNLNGSPRDLFSSTTVVERTDAKSRGWNILQKAFVSRHEIGPDGMVWTKIMRGGTRLSRRKSEFRARQRRISELFNSNREFHTRKNSKQFNCMDSVSESPINSRQSSIQMESSLSKDSSVRQALQRTAIESSDSETPSELPSSSKSFPSQGKHSPKSSLRPISLLPLQPGALKSPSGNHSRMIVSHANPSEIENFVPSEEDSETPSHYHSDKDNMVSPMNPMGRTTTSSSLSSKRQVGFSSTEAVVAPVELLDAPGMLPEVHEFISEIPVEPCKSPDVLQ